jgi:hypothetical protein
MVTSLTRLSAGIALLLVPTTAFPIGLNVGAYWQPGFPVSYYDKAANPTIIAFASGADLEPYPFLGLYIDYDYSHFNVEQDGDIEDIYPLYDIYHILSFGSYYSFDTGNLNLRLGGGFSYTFETVDYGPPDPYSYTRWPDDENFSGPGLHISMGSRYPIVNSVFQVVELKYSSFFYDKRLESGMYITRDHSPTRTDFLNLRVGLEVGII